jgi:uncharacterized repeat protein (TIGR03803 family)
MQASSILMRAIMVTGLGMSALGAYAKSQTFSVHYAFVGASAPHDDLLADAAGNLYGVTASGSINNSGAVFKLSPDGHETVLYSFTGGSDGGNPIGPLISDSAGNLYGTTKYGGINNGGTIFKLTPSGIESVLYAFTVYGSQPTSGLIADGSGNFYGETAYGANMMKASSINWPPTEQRARYSASWVCPTAVTLRAVSLWTPRATSTVSRRIAAPAGSERSSN